jgi:SAM-dependent methyltransferase
MAALRALNARWDGRPEEYEQLRRCWLNERRARFLTDRLERAGLPDGTRVLELGSGTGWLLRELARRLPNLEFVGVEPDPSYVAFARERAGRNERHLQGTAEELPAEVTACSAVLSNDVLHHVRSIPATFHSAAAAARPGARWWAMEPNCLNPYTFVRQQLGFGERNFFSGKAVRAAAADGWRLERRDHLFLVPPFVREAPGWMVALERRLEGVPPLAGGVCLQLALSERRPEPV